MLFDIDLSSCEARKRLYGISDLINKIREEGFKTIDGNEILEKIKKEKIALEKEKIKLQDQRREYKKLIRQVARDEQLIEIIQNIAKDMQNIKPFEWQPVPYQNYTNEGVALWSDWHSELEVDNFLNKFNKDEFIRRINKLVYKTIEYGHLHKIKTLHVLNLNDLMSGVIHNTLRITANEDIVSQTMFISELICDILAKFANEFQEVKFYNVTDNHSRVIPDKDNSLNKENFSRFIPWYVKARLSNIKNLRVVENALDDDIIVFNIYDYICFAVHGHNDSISNIVQNLSLMIKTIPDYIFMGHYHRNASDEVHGCEVIVNSSLIGSDDYSKNKRKTSKPAQKFAIFNEDGLLCTYSIKLN